MTNTRKFQLTHTTNGETYEFEIVVSNSGMHHRGHGMSGATWCNGRTGIYVQTVQKGGVWEPREGTQLCKKCFGS